MSKENKTTCLLLVWLLQENRLNAMSNFAKLKIYTLGLKKMQSGILISQWKPQNEVKEVEKE